MVFRVYAEKKPELSYEAKSLLSELNGFLGIHELKKVRIVNRYDVENIDEHLFDYAVRTVFSEPQLDLVHTELKTGSDKVFAVEYLPGQFDQRADSAAQCIQIISQKERPLIRTAKVYVLSGAISTEQFEEIKKYVINPVEAREASLEKPETLAMNYDVPKDVEILTGFTKASEMELSQMHKKYGLAMDMEDLKFCRDYFLEEKRDPSITELRMIDTYWSDHCRHTTFLTEIDHVEFEDEILAKAFEEYTEVRRKLGRKKPVCLMDLATIAAKALKEEGKLSNLDESEEINACTVRILVEKEGKKEPWLLLFKNETHNHPTEIEPFGGAATCIGGAIRDPLSGRAYVYAAMRVTGAADPLKPIKETLPGKLPQRKIVTTAAAGYASYGNQIGLATGIVDEIYHDGYAAKRMEIGAVIGAAPAGNVRREVPKPGDVVILLGGKTGRDGCGGATGSSKSHTVESLETCGAEVQKGNAPEERKLQRLFRNQEASRLIKRCNDFGAGGVSVAIGELADGLDINLDVVPKKYEGLDGTELAISESQERMAVVVSEEDAGTFIRLAGEENLQATPVAVVKKEPVLTMKWNGKEIVNLKRSFLNSNGAPKHVSIQGQASKIKEKTISKDFIKNYKELAADLNCCSKRGLSERFDSTIGAGTVLMPFGGKYQRTPIQAMVHTIPVLEGETKTCSYMAFGYNPFISEQSPYHGAYLAVVESVCKLIATGASSEEVYLTFQEYFESPGKDGKRWGKPLSALLGAFKAQMGLGIAAIGGKDSMSGSFEKLDVPPTLVSFAVTTGKTDEVISPEFKRAGHSLILIEPQYGEDGLPDADSLKEVLNHVYRLLHGGHAFACYTPGMGGIAEAVLKMAFGNQLGFEYNAEMPMDMLFGCRYGSFLVEVDDQAEAGVRIGTITEDAQIVHGDSRVALAKLLELYEGKLESIYPCYPEQSIEMPDENYSYTAGKPGSAAIKTARPKVLIPAFPGTNCEYDSARAMERAGAKAEIMVINNLSAEGIAQSVETFARQLKEAQMIFIPGGFSGGDEPEGSGKFITAFFRNEAVKVGVTDLLENRDGLICGICNGFQALIKLGLVPYGKIVDTDAGSPTLTFNKIDRHQSRITATRIASNKSPWLSHTHVGEIYHVPISHGEGRFYADAEVVKKLAANGQIATQYVDGSGNATNDILYNPNGSIAAIEGITSPDGRVFGKMGHSERIGKSLYKNVEGNYNICMFESAVRYFSG